MSDVAWSASGLKYPWRSKAKVSRISIDPKVCHGQACVRGTRVPVHQIVRMLANGDTVEGLLEDYPHLTREDILAALEYAASLAEERVGPIPPTEQAA